MIVIIACQGGHCPRGRARQCRVNTRQKSPYQAASAPVQAGSSSINDSWTGFTDGAGSKQHSLVRTPDWPPGQDICEGQIITGYVAREEPHSMPSWERRNDWLSWSRGLKPTSMDRSRYSPARATYHSEQHGRLQCNTHLSSHGSPRHATSRMAERDHAFSERTPRLRTRNLDSLVEYSAVSPRERLLSRPRAPDSLSRMCRWTGDPPVSSWRLYISCHRRRKSD